MENILMKNIHTRAEKFKSNTPRILTGLLAMQAIWAIPNKILNPTDKHIIYTFFNNAASTEAYVSFRSVQSLSIASECSPKTVQKTISKLHELGFLVSQQRRGNGEGAGQDTSLRCFTPKALEIFNRILDATEEAGCLNEHIVSAAAKIIHSYDEKPVEKPVESPVSGDDILPGGVEIECQGGVGTDYQDKEVVSSETEQGKGKEDLKTLGQQECGYIQRTKAFMAQGIEGMLRWGKRERAKKLAQYKQARLRNMLNEPLPDGLHA
ncbi:TPA: hypothetical protein ACGQ50_000763 [Enterobacter cloacae]